MNKNEKKSRRFNEKTDGEMVRKYFAKMPTAELAQMMGLEPRKISDFAHRNNFEPYLSDLGDGSDDPISRGNGITQNRPQDPTAELTLLCNLWITGAFGLPFFLRLIGTTLENML